MSSLLVFMPKTQILALVLTSTVNALTDIKHASSIHYFTEHSRSAPIGKNLQLKMKELKYVSEQQLPTKTG